MRALLLKRIDFAPVVRWLRASWLESALALTLLSGWGLLVWGIGEIVAPWLSDKGVWAIGAGLLLLGVCGFSLIAKIAKHGLYALSQVKAP